MAPYLLPLYRGVIVRAARTYLPKEPGFFKRGATWKHSRNVIQQAGIAKVTRVFKGGKQGKVIQIKNPQA